MEAAIEKGKVVVAPENVERFRLDLGKELVGDAARIEVAIDGRSLEVKPGTIRFALESGKWAAAGPLDDKTPVKRHGLSGPIQDVFMGGPVLIVYGTADGQKAEASRKMIDGAVMRLFGPGDGGAILHTPFARKSDRDLTDEDVKANHLILFGKPSQNSYVKKIAGKLPITFLDDGVRVGDKTYRGEGVGLTMVYPNPLNPRRYVLLMPRDYAGGSPLALPDYVVGKRVESGKRVSQQVLAKGSFDGRWKLGQ
jgi:hypothetical protein